LVYLIQILTTYLGLYIEWGVLPSAKFISSDIKVNICSILLQFLLMPIPILIANITRNIIVPIVYGLLGDVMVGLLLGAGANIYSQFCPLTLPILPFYHYHKGYPIDIVIVSGSAVITFSLFMFLCTYHYSKVDID
jgi:bacitracin transport system permease protein